MHMSLTVVALSTFLGPAMPPGHVPDQEALDQPFSRVSGGRERVGVDDVELEGRPRLIRRLLASGFTSGLGLAAR